MVENIGSAPICVRIANAVATLSSPIPRILVPKVGFEPTL